MANEYCTGAIAIYVEPRQNNKSLTGIKLLGTCETAPQRQTNRPYKQLRNDLSSDQAFDYVYAGGDEAVTSLILTWWNDDVALALERSPTNQALGQASLADMGALMGQEGFGWKLHIVHAFGGIVPSRPSMVNQESGRIYVQSIFWGPESDEGGSRERKKHMVFRSWKEFDPSLKRFTLFLPVTGTYSLV